MRGGQWAARARLLPEVLLRGASAGTWGVGTMLGGRDTLPDAGTAGFLRSCARRIRAARSCSRARGDNADRSSPSQSRIARRSRARDRRRGPRTWPHRRARHLARAAAAAVARRAAIERRAPSPTEAAARRRRPGIARRRPSSAAASAAPAGSRAAAARSARRRAPRPTRSACAQRRARQAVGAERAGRGSASRPPWRARARTGTASRG